MLERNEAIFYDVIKNIGIKYKLDQVELENMVTDEIDRIVNNEQNKVGGKSRRHKYKRKTKRHI